MTSDHLQEIVETPMSELRFHDFAELKSGRDRFSAFRLPRLRELVAEHRQVEEAFEHEQDVASCLRWVLRGLPIDKAIRKVKTDVEIRENAISARKKDSVWI